ncbi:hypothetical protein Moror_7019 [Moniliophthora roreri MCA 2997]|uniref:Pre-rrna processing protein n=2 Tax=Moniliophthora roreri TaxID=221103 RepID=V2XUH5_MONRO|nr:hypothetical protein Moror_7019 [Moniliophthora roreri MCA 2997]
MNSDEESNSSARVDKGKGKAQDEPTERTPLLGSSAGGSSSELDTTPSYPHRNITTTLLNVFLGTLILCIIAFIVFALLTWSYVSRASDLSPEDVLHRAVVFEGPQKVIVINTSWTEGMWVNVEGRVGVDAGSVLGVNRDPDGGDGFLKNIWKSLGRWGIQELHQVTVKTSTINITSQYDTTIVLASLDIPPLDIHLTADPPSDHSWLHRVSTPVLMRPTHNTSALIDFARETWRLGHVAVRTEVANLDVQGGRLHGDSWRGMLHRTMSDVKTLLTMKIPLLPGFPQPGKNTPFPSIAELITLCNFTLSTVTDHLMIDAVATVVDPAPPNFALTTPSLPFIVSLVSNTSSPIPVASVTSKPFNLTHPNITLDISGRVLPLSPEALPLLSTFISRYLTALSNPIVISTPLVPDLEVDVDFPPPNVRPRILRNVTIHDMKIKPGNTFLASGTVYGRIVLPPGMNVGLDVKRVLPDVLVFDGEVPDSLSSSPPPRRPLPDPLPEKAFGHIRPDDWLVSRCVAVEPEDGDGATFAVTAKIVDVPLEVLPDRHQEFSDFVGKVIFGRDGALAGILGSTDVGVLVQGLPLPGPEHGDGMVLSDLPFKGSVRIGKRNLFSDYWTRPTD